MSTITWTLAHTGAAGEADVRAAFARGEPAPALSPSAVAALKRSARQPQHSPVAAPEAGQHGSDGVQQYRAARQRPPSTAAAAAAGYAAAAAAAAGSAAGLRGLLGPFDRIPVPPDAPRAHPLGMGLGAQVRGLDWGTNGADRQPLRLGHLLPRSTVFTTVGDRKAHRGKGEAHASMCSPGQRRRALQTRVRAVRRCVARASPRTCHPPSASRWPSARLATRAAFSPC
jgi:hypothetical protein